MKDIFKKFKKIFKKEKEEPEWVKQLKEDYGKDDIFGPWTKEYKKGDPMKFYKSYWLISTNETPNISPFTNDN